MSDEQDKRGAPGNRTIQVDALTDVELIENAALREAVSSDESEEGPAAAPPPLPPRSSLAGAPAATPAKKAGVPWIAIGLTVVITGVLGAAAAHFLVPSAAPAPPAASPPPPATEVRRVITLDDELVISAESTDAGADAGLAE